MRGVRSKRTVLGLLKSLPDWLKSFLAGWSLFLAGYNLLLAGWSPSVRGVITETLPGWL